MRLVLSSTHIKNKESYHHWGLNLDQSLVSIPLATMPRQQSYSNYIFFSSTLYSSFTSLHSSTSVNSYHQIFSFFPFRHACCPTTYETFCLLPIHDAHRKQLGAGNQIFISHFSKVWEIPSSTPR